MVQPRLGHDRGEKTSWTCHRDAYNCSKGNYSGGDSLHDRSEIQAIELMGGARCSVVSISSTANVRFGLITMNARYSREKRHFDVGIINADNPDYRLETI